MENQLWTYLIAISLLTVTPGVDTVLVIRNTTRGGWWDGAVSSFGICSGLFVHAAVSAVGISVILLQSAWAFRTLKLAGAGYLIWLGLVSLRNTLGKGDGLLQDTNGGKAAVFNARRSLMEGLLSNVLNPKTVVFYMAFLPQFIDPSGSPLKQAFCLAGMHFLIAMTWQCLLASGVNRAKRFLGKSSVKKTLDGMTGAVMIFFGIKLAMYR